ncbi:hypothetical protein [Shewanella algidipiscicola]|uniref:hypothetical protein n=1 Tax=Shewanella algidipiscicola TaxID=614070 RepID=UPI0013C53000|nr:hypothetical protein [Shewanella algidipiscicola]
MTFRDMDVTAEPTGIVLEQRPCLKASSASMPLVRKREAGLHSPCHRSTCTKGMLQAIYNNVG